MSAVRVLPSKCLSSADENIGREKRRKSDEENRCGAEVLIPFAVSCQDVEHVCMGGGRRASSLETAEMPRRSRGSKYDDQKQERTHLPKSVSREQNLL